MCYSTDIPKLQELECNMNTKEDVTDYVEQLNLEQVLRVLEYIRMLQNEDVE